MNILTGCPDRKVNQLSTIEDLLKAGPTVALWPTAGQVLSISKSHTYKLARDDQFPAKVIKVGASYRVVTADLLRLLDATEVA